AYAAHRSSTVVLLQGTYTPSVHAHAGRTQNVGWRFAYPTYDSGLPVPTHAMILYQQERLHYLIQMTDQS
ncbi:MAG: hypothetical protein ABW158_22470, partial [Candidatus Thiodiazotropha sp. 6PDIVS]